MLQRVINTAGVTLPDESRPIVVTVNEFDEDALRKFNEDVSKAHATGQDVLPIVIDSYGGDAHALLGMLAVIDACTLPVVTICESKAVSCGLFLFSAGSERIAAPTATFMLHDISMEVAGKTADITVNAFEMERVHNLVFTRLARACGKSAAYFEKLLDAHKHADYFLSAKQALEHGLATKVGTVRLDTTVVAVTSLHVTETATPPPKLSAGLTRKKKHR